MSKRIIMGILSVVLILALSIVSCNNTVDSKTSTTAKILTTTSTTTTHIIATVPLITTTGSTIIIPQTPTTPTINTLPPYTAEMIITPLGQNDVLFTNNLNAYYEFTCDVRLHAADGSFIKDAQIISGFIPPHSSRVAVLPPDFIPVVFVGGIRQITSPEDIVKDITIANLQMQHVSVRDQPIFATVALKDIALTTTDISGTGFTNLFSNGKAVPTLTGKLYNKGQQFLQAHSIIQVFKNTPNGSLTLVGEGEVSLPPSGEFVNISVLIWDIVSIKDSANGLIDGEITIVIQN